MSKSKIRQEILLRRDALSPLEVEFLSAAVVTQFLASTVYSAASTLALYSSHRSEVATSGIFAAAVQDGKRILYPRTVGAVLEFIAVESQDALKEGRFGIREPEQGEAFPLSEIDLIVLPGVAFDLDGLRLGYGLGCYDRALAAGGGATLVGLAYDFQIVPSLPREDHDVPVNFVVSERGILSM